MDDLPYELVVHITSFLEPLAATRLQQTAKRYLRVCRDNNLWRTHSFETSLFLQRLRRRQAFLGITASQTNATPAGNDRDLAAAIVRSASGEETPIAPKGDQNSSNIRTPAAERVRILANWDPSYPTEKVSWFTEYVQRNAPIKMSWLEVPKEESASKGVALDVKGVALWKDAYAVSPLEDGGLCIYDFMGAHGRKGSICGRGKANMLVCDSGNRQKFRTSGVVECVSLDEAQDRGYFAIESSLFEVDLKTIQVINEEKFPFSIQAVSSVHPDLPMIIGTTNSLHMHDPRAPLLHRASGHEIVEPVLNASRSQHLRNLLLTGTHNYAPLFRPGPTAIVCLKDTPASWTGNGEIWVAGRYPSILNYDTRAWPKLRGTIHSGSTISAMIAMPSSFSSSEQERMRAGELSTEAAMQARARKGSTLVAVGGYNSGNKGSLELYGLSPEPQYTTLSTSSAAGHAHDAVFKNRQTASGSKLLSIATHGTKLVYSDGSGHIKWCERDGFTPVRSFSFKDLLEPEEISLWPSASGVQSGDLVRKIVNFQATDKTVNNSDLLLWTGESLGILSFSSQKGKDEFEEEIVQTVAEQLRDQREKDYGETMMRALESHASEMHFFSNLDIG